MYFDVLFICMCVLCLLSFFSAHGITRKFLFIFILLLFPIFMLSLFIDLSLLCLNSSPPKGLF